MSETFSFLPVTAFPGTIPKLALWWCAKFEIQSASYHWDYSSVLHGCICWVEKRQLATSWYVALVNTAFLFHKHYWRVLRLLTGLVESIWSEEVGMTAKATGWR